jgi:hypothetical protein
MTRLLTRGTAVAICVLVAFNVAVMGLWHAAGSVRDALVGLAGWIAGDAMLCLVALWAADR